MSLLEFFPVRKLEKEGKYSAPCPSCGGKDRFFIWPYQGKGGRYYCRQCGITGDAIQFLQEFHNMDFRQACDRLNVSSTDDVTPPFLEPTNTTSPDWKNRAREVFNLIRESMTAPHIYRQAELAFLERGISMATVQAQSLAYMYSDEYDDLSNWDITCQKYNKLLIPGGIVIATEAQGEITALTVRRGDDKPKDKPRYHQVRGGAKNAFCVGKNDMPVMILESALDAILLHQETGCAAVALMGCGKQLDEHAKTFIEAAPRVFICMDNDEAGFKARSALKKIFPSGMDIYTPCGAKDVGDLYKLHISSKQGVPSVKEWYEYLLTI